MAAVRAQRALGAAGGARRVEDGDGIVGLEPRDRVVGDGRAVREVLERRVGAAVGAHADDLHSVGPPVGVHAPRRSSSANATDAPVAEA